MNLAGPNTREHPKSLYKRVYIQNLFVNFFPFRVFYFVWYDETNMTYLWGVIFVQDAKHDPSPQNLFIY